MTECHDLDHISEHYMSVDVHRRMLGRIADVTRSRRPRWLDVTDIIDIADDADVSDVPPQELADFRAVYLALVAIDRDSAHEQRQYVLIELADTVKRSDIERAARNAGYMTRFTGLPAKAVVIGKTLPDGIAEAARARSVSCLVLLRDEDRA